MFLKTLCQFQRSRKPFSYDFSRRKPFSYDFSSQLFYVFSRVEAVDLVPIHKQNSQLNEQTGTVQVGVPVKAKKAKSFP